MSALGNTLRALRGKKPQAEVAKAIDLNVRTIQRAEIGQDVHLSTLKTMARHYGVNTPAYAKLLVDWVNLQLGDDAALLIVRPKGKPANITEEERFMSAFKQVPARYQRELHRAMARQEVLRSLEPLNDLADKIANGKA